MRKYQYDDEYFVALESNVFLKFDNVEEEEAFAIHLEYGKRW